MNVQGDKRPADVIVNAVRAMQVAMGEIEESGHLEAS
jgi:hypothetical protein